MDAPKDIIFGNIYKPSQTELAYILINLGLPGTRDPVTPGERNGFNRAREKSLKLGI